MVSREAEVNVMALVKGSERYIFFYDDESAEETLKVLGRFASNPELGFTLYDAAVLSQKIRQTKKQQEHEKEILAKQAMRALMVLAKKIKPELP